MQNDEPPLHSVAPHALRQDKNGPKSKKVGNPWFSGNALAWRSEGCGFYDTQAT